MGPILAKILSGAILYLSCIYSIFLYKYSKRFLARFLWFEYSFWFNGCWLMTDEEIDGNTHGYENMHSTRFK